MSFLGLFDSEYRTTVATQVQRVIDDAGVPDSIKVGTIKALFQEGNLPDYQMEELVGGLGTKAERMYRYADKHYTYGLPSGEVYSNTQGRAQVEEVLELLEGQQVSIEYSHFGLPNLMHIAWSKLVAQYGYNYETNEITALSAQKGAAVYLKDMQVVVPSNKIDSISTQRTERWGTAPNGGYCPERPLNTGDVRDLTPPSPVVSSAVATEPCVWVTYSWVLYGQTYNAQMTLLMSEFDTNDGFFQAKYYVNNVAKFWMYKHGAGQHSQLDNVYVDGAGVAGSYFPMTYFRFDKAAIPSSSDAYKTSKKMLKTLGMDYNLVADAINSNPNIGDVEQAILTFAVPSVSSNQAECRYLFDYFDTQHEALGGNTDPRMGIVMAQVFEGGGGLFGNMLAALFDQIFTKNTTVIQDGRFKMTLHNGGIYKRVRAGVIGAVGDYTSGFNDSVIQQKISVESVNETTGTTTYSDSIQNVPFRVHCYRHQISPNVYEEVLVSNLKMTYYIWNGYNTTADDTDDTLLIPLDRTITENYPITVREVLYARSLHLVFNARSTQEIKWYQQTWFQVVLIVVAIVLTVVTEDASGSWIAKTLELTGTDAIIATVVFNMVVSMYVLPQVFKLFVKVFGVEVAQLIAVAAIIYGGYELASNGVKGAPFAGDMLMLSTGLSKEVLTVKYQDLLDEQKMFETVTQEKVKELEEAQKLLETNTVLDPFVIFGEKPQEYFNRTVHYGNIGTLGINAISSYVDIALTLPKVQDTLGEPLNG